jgi:hypothetical protein
LRYLCYSFPTCQRAARFYSTISRGLEGVAIETTGTSVTIRFDEPITGAQIKKFIELFTGVFGEKLCGEGVASIADDNNSA